jgi:AAA domain
MLAGGTQRVSDKSTDAVGVALAGIRTAAIITQAELSPVQYLTHERIPCGLVLLAARPKAKKSWLALQAAKAAAEGGEMLGMQTRKGRALGLFLEDNERRMKHRLAFLGGEKMAPEALARLHVTFAWPKGEPGVAALRDWMGRYPDTILIVIDVLQKFRSEQNSRASAYSHDYAALESLQALARDYPDLCILVLHHTRKAAATLPAEKVSGTNAITGAADAYIILDVGPEPNTAKAHIDGRDWELWVHDFVWRFEEGIGWTHVRLITDKDSLTPSQREWFDLVRLKGPFTPSQAAKERGVSASAASQMLSQLAARGFLRCDRGHYSVLVQSRARHSCIAASLP